MRIEAYDYVHVAEERLSDANLLYEKARYAFALYAAGVAVESLLRAYVVRLEPVLETAHDLRLLLKASKLRSLLMPVKVCRLILQSWICSSDGKTICTILRMVDYVAV